MHLDPIDLYTTAVVAADDGDVDKAADGRVAFPVETEEEQAARFEAYAVSTNPFPTSRALSTQTTSSGRLIIGVS